MLSGANDETFGFATPTASVHVPMQIHILRNSGNTDCTEPNTSKGSPRQAMLLAMTELLVWMVSRTNNDNPDLDIPANSNSIPA